MAGKGFVNYLLSSKDLSGLIKRWHTLDMNTHVTLNLISERVYINLNAFDNDIISIRCSIHPQFNFPFQGRRQNS